MTPCNATATVQPNDQMPPVELACSLRKDHEGPHFASFTFNGVYAEAEWPVETPQ